MGLKKVLIFGANGILGSYLSNFLVNKGINISRIGRLDGIKIDDFIKNTLCQNVDDFTTIINCVALTNVDKCENDINLAFESNAQFVNKIISEIDINNKHFIQISTDQVYSGKGPHKEENPSPLNIYGLTKHLGEQYCNSIFSTILRVNYLAKSKSINKYSFVDWLYQSLNNHKEIILFDNVIFNPLYVIDLCGYIFDVIQNPKSGIYNLGSRNFISKADFGLKFAKKLNLDTSYIKIGKSFESNLIAKRPYDMSLDITKFEKTFDKRLPNVENIFIKLSHDFLK